jgi:hypothetical protein
MNKIPPHKDCIQHQETEIKSIRHLMEILQNLINSKPWMEGKVEATNYESNFPIFERHEDPIGFFTRDVLEIKIHLNGNVTKTLFEEENE